MARIDDILKEESLAFRARPVEVAPTPEPVEEPGFTDVAGVGLRSLARVPQNIAANVITAVQGQSGVEAPGQGDFFEELGRGIRTRERETQAADVARFPESDAIGLASRVGQQLAFSAGPTAAGVAAGVVTSPLAALPGGQAAPFVAGGAAAGTVAFRQSSADIMTTFIESLDEDKRAEEGRGLTPDETDAAKLKFSARATEFGLWEAIPEAVGGAIAGRLIFGPLVKVVGKKVANKMLRRLGAAAGVAGEELATETVTQIGQEQTLAGTDLGVAEEDAPSFTSAEDIIEAFKTIAPDTLLLTAIMGGGLKGGQLALQRRAEGKLAKELNIDRPLLRQRVRDLATLSITNPEVEITRDVMNQYLAGAVTIKEGEVVPTATPTEDTATSEVAPTVTPPAAESTTTTEDPLTEETPVPQEVEFHAGSIIPATVPQEDLLTFQRAATKLGRGQTDFTLEEIEVRQNYSQEMETTLQELQRLQEGEQATPQEGVQEFPDAFIKTEVDGVEVQISKEQSVRMQAEADRQVKLLIKADPSLSKADALAQVREGIFLQAKDIQTLNQGIAADTGLATPEGAYTSAQAPKGTEEAFKALSAITGSRIVFFKQGENAPITINGATRLPGDPTVIYVNVDAKKPHIVVAGHEFLHNLKAEDPQAYAEALPAILKVIPESVFTQRLEALNGQRRAQGRKELSKADIQEEVVADYFGEQFQTKEFWAKVEKNNPTTFSRIAESFIRFIESIKSQFTGAQAKDLEAAQNAAVEALARYVRKNPEADVSPGLKEAAKLDEVTDRKFAIARELSKANKEAQDAQRQPVEVSEAAASAVAQDDQAGAEELPFQTHPAFDHGHLGDRARWLGSLANSALEAGFSIEEVKADIATEINSRARADKTIVPEMKQVLGITSFDQIVSDYPQWVKANEGTIGGAAGVRFDEATTAGATTEGQEKIAERLWAEKGTDSPFFKKWFGDSKVVDQGGDPLVVYHGSRYGGITEFSKRHVGSGVVGSNSSGGFYFSSSQEAASFFADPILIEKETEDTLSEDDTQVYGEEGAFYILVGEDINTGPFPSHQAAEQAATAIINAYNTAEVGDTVFEDDKVSAQFLKIENPKIVGSMAEFRAVERTAEAEGFDGIIVKDVADGDTVSDVYVAFSPNQIKSATGNQGTFSSETGDIRFDEPAQAMDTISGQRKNNSATLLRHYTAGTVRAASIPKLLKVTPLAIVQEGFQKLIPQLPAFVKAMRRLDAKANDLADIAGIQAQEILNTVEKKFGSSKFGTGKGFKRGVEKFQEAAMLSSFYQMAPQVGIMEQKRVPEHGTVESRLKGAQTSWEASGLQEATGKTFREAYNLAATSFNGLGEALQEEYLKAVEQMQDTRAKEFDLSKQMTIKATKEGSPIRKQFLDAMEIEFNTLQGNYWPLYRYGDFTLTYNDPTDGVTVFETFDRPSERAEAREALIRMGVDPQTMQEGAKVDAEPVLTGAPVELFKQLKTATLEAELSGLGNNPTPEEVTAANQRADTAIDNMTQVWLKWQPETSAVKNSLRRQNVRGASRQMLRGYLKYMQSHGLRIAQMEEGGKIDDILKQMDQGLREKRLANKDTTEDQQVINDLRARVGANKTSRTGWLARVLGRMSTLYMMTSPSIALVQMSQLGVLTLPRLATQFGLASATKHLTTGTQRAFSPTYKRTALFADVEVNEVYDNLNRTVTSEDQAEGLFPDKQLGDTVFTKSELQKQIDAMTDEQRRKLALRDALGRGIMDISLSHEVGEWVRGGDPTSLSNKVLSALMFFMRESETASRKATVMATFEAADGHKDFFSAMDTAEEVTDATLFDYSAGSKGVALRGDTAKVLLTFQHFRIMAAFRIGLLFKRSISAETTEIRTAARKEFIGIMAMSGALSGALGMPFVPILLDVLSAALSDDDEPVDAEAELLQWSKETFGEDVGQAVVRGPGTLMNLSIAQRIGLGDVFGSRTEPSPTIHGRALSSYLTTQMLGPAYSVTEGWFKGYDEMVNKGNYRKGLEFAVPKPMRDVLRAYGLATEGVSTGDGKRLLKAENVSAGSVLLLALGFQPTDVFEMKQEEFRLDQMSAVISERRGRLMRSFVRGFNEGDSSEAIADVVAFNKKNPRFALRGTDLSGAIRKAVKGEAGVESRRELLVKQRFGQ